jgi:hypothetical protein
MGLCTVSEKYKFGFIHVLKSGGLLINNWFIAALCDGEAKKNGDYYPTADVACPREVLYHALCSYLPNDRSFFMFAFVHHPEDRVISQVFSITLGENLSFLVNFAVLLFSSQKPETFLHFLGSFGSMRWLRQNSSFRGLLLLLKNLSSKGLPP